MNNYKRMGVTKGEYGKPGYLHAVVKITEEQEKILEERIRKHLQETGEEYVSNDDHWKMTFEVLKETREKNSTPSSTMPTT